MSQEPNGERGVSGVLGGPEGLVRAEGSEGEREAEFIVPFLPSPQAYKARQRAGLLCLLPIVLYFA